MKGVVLVVDNDKAFRETCVAILKEDGYETREAATPEEARQALVKGGIDLAVIDVRLKDDNNPDDRSGLELVKDKEFHNTPKIIFTAYAIDRENVGEILRIAPNSLPGAVNILDKPKVMSEFAKTVSKTLEHVPLTSEVRFAGQPLLENASHAISLWPKLLIAMDSTSKVNKKIDQYHDAVNKQANYIFQVATAIAILGTLIVLIGIAVSLMGYLTIGAIATAGGIVDTLAAIFYARLNEANRRVDVVYRHELLQTQKLELLLYGYSYLLPGDEQVAMQKEILEHAVASWFPIKTNDTGNAQ
jgi:CheY-like chemotaxis protein